MVTASDLNFNIQEAPIHRMQNGAMGQALGSDNDSSSFAMANNFEGDDELGFLGQETNVQNGEVFDVGLYRPYRERNGYDYVDLYTGRELPVVKNKALVRNKYTGEPILRQERVKISVMALQNMGYTIPALTNNVSTLRKDEWQRMDRAVIEVSRRRLRAWRALSAKSSLSGFQAMNKMVLEHETVSDPGTAQVDMDGLSEGFADSARFGREGTPLPITHHDFYFSDRRLRISRNGGTPLSTIQTRSGTRRIAESVEKTLLGVQAGVTFGSMPEYGRPSKVYGYTNFPARLTYSTTAPTGSNGPAILTEWLAMRNVLHLQNQYGPYDILVSDDWDLHLDNNFSSTEPSAGTLRERLLKIDGINSIQRADYLTTAKTVVWVEPNVETAVAVNGTAITIIQWPSMGGMRHNFKILTIKTPQLKSDYNGRTGILHGA